MSNNKDYKINLEYNRERKTIDIPEDYDELKDKFATEFNEIASKKVTFNFFEDDEEYEIDENNFSEMFEKIKKSDSKNIFVSDEKEVDPMRQTHNFSVQLNKKKEKKKEEELELERINELKNSNSSGQENVSEFIMGRTLDERINIENNNIVEKKDEYEDDFQDSRENEDRNDDRNDDRNNVEILQMNSKEIKELVISEHLNDSKDNDVNKLNESIKQLKESENKYKIENDNLLKSLEKEKEEKKKLEDRVKSLKNSISKEQKEKSKLKNEKKEIESRYEELENKLNESQSKIRLEESGDNAQIIILKEKNVELTNDCRNLESENIKLKNEIEKEKEKNSQNLDNSDYNLIKEENSQLKIKIKNLQNDLNKNSKNTFAKPETIFDEEEKEKIYKQKNKKIKKLAFINQMMKKSVLENNKQSKNKKIKTDEIIQEEQKSKKTIIEKQKTKIIQKKEEDLQKAQEFKKKNEEEMTKYKKQIEEQNNELKKRDEEEITKYKKQIEEKNNEIKQRDEKINNLQNQLKTAKELKDSKEGLDKERNDYETRIKNLRDKNKILNDELNIKMKSYEDKLQNDKINMDELKKQINSLTKEKNKFEEKLNDYQNKIEEYKSELSKSQLIQLEQNNKNKQYELKKKEYHDTLEKKYEKLYQERLKEATNQITNNQVTLIKKYEQQIKDMEVNYNKKFDNMSKIILENQNKSNIKKCKTIHNDIKCNNCYKEPIIGYRYKCLTCNEFNLCEECEEANESSNAHPHLFIKMAKYVQDINKISPKKNVFNFNDNDNNNKGKARNNDDNEFQIIKFGKEDDYSLEVINKHNLNPSITEGDYKLDIELIIKNNGSKQWPENGAKLVFNENKDLVDKDILLKPQKPEEQQKYLIKLEGLNVYSAGNVEGEMNFEINGEKYGDEIDINIKINEKKKGNDDDGDDDGHLKQLKEFRKEYGLSEEEYSDEMLLDKLRKHNFNFAEAFASIFD